MRFTLHNITTLFTILVIAFTPLDALEITEGSNVTFGRYFFILMSVFALFSGDLKIKQSMPLLKILAPFIVWAFMTSLWGIDMDATLGRVILLVQYAVILVVMVNTLNTPRALKLGMIGWVLGTAYIAYKTATDFSLNAEMARGLYRVGEFGNPNENSFMLCYALVFCFMVDRTRRRLPSILFIMYAALSIVANGSRMGVLLYALAIASFCVQLWQSKKRWYVLALVPVIVFMGASQLDRIPTETLTRILGISSDIQEGDLSNREDIWRAAMQMIEANPNYALIGCGWGTFILAIRRYVGYDIGAHNFYIDVFATTGIVGLSIVVVYLRKLYLMIRHTYKADIMNYMMIILPLISMMSTNWQSRRWWFMMGAFIYLIYKTNNFNNAVVQTKQR